MSDDLEDIVDNLREPSAWIRIVFMVGFTVVLYLIIAPVVLVLMIVQALFSVLSGETNYNLRRFGKALAEYVQQILHYLSYNTNDKPFPFSDFPALEEDEESADPAPGEKESSAQENDSRAAPKKATRKKSATKKPAAKKAAKKAGASKAAKKPSAESEDSDTETRSQSADSAAEDEADKS